MKLRWAQVWSHRPTSSIDSSDIPHLAIKYDLYYVISIPKVDMFLHNYTIIRKREIEAGEHEYTYIHGG